VRRKGGGISTVTPIPAADSYATGAHPGPGTYFCLECGLQLSLVEDDRLPACPGCGASSFQLDSIFEPMQDHGGTTAEFMASTELEPPSWLDEARAAIAAGSRHLVCRDGEEMLDFEVERGWTRIGRSIAADIQLDDPSVSRRHALIVSEPGKPLRVLDDRSLNGVHVNDDVVDWGRLEDGDELTIGRYRLFVIEA